MNNSYLKTIILINKKIIFNKLMKIKRNKNNIKLHFLNKIVNLKETIT